MRLDPCYWSYRLPGVYPSFSGIQVPLTVDNIQTILNTLLYDGKAEMTVVVSQVTGEGEGDIQKLYRASPPLLQSTGFSRVPCGVCPVSNTI